MSTSYEFLPNFSNQRELQTYEGYERLFLLPTKAISPFEMLNMHFKTLKFRPRLVEEPEKSAALPGQQDFLLEYSDDTRLHELYLFPRFTRDSKFVKYVPNLTGFIGDYNRELIKSKMFGHYNQLWISRYSSVLRLEQGDLAYLDHDLLVAERGGFSRVTVTFDSVTAMENFEPLPYFGPEITELPGQSLMEYALAGYFVDPVAEDVFYSI